MKGIPARVSPALTVFTTPSPAQKGTVPTIVCDKGATEFPVPFSQ